LALSDRKRKKGTSQIMAKKVPISRVVRVGTLVHVDLYRPMWWL